MMFGKSSSILRIILMYEEKAKEAERPKGVAPRRSLGKRLAKGCSRRAGACSCHAGAC